MKIFRFVQYSLIAVVGCLEMSSDMTLGYSQLLLVAYAHQIGRVVTIFSRARKAIRFVRGRLLLQSIWNSPILAGQDCPHFKIKTAENILVLLSSISDGIFYFTDHYAVFSLLGIVSNESHLAFYDDIGNWMWAVCSTFMVAALFLRFWFYYLTIKEEKEWERLKKLVLMDIIRNSIEITMGIFFLNPHLVSKTTKGLTAVSAIVLGLIRFDYI